MDGRVYLDHNATTPIDKEVKKSIIEALEFWGNPSSSNEFGARAKQKIETARAQIATAIGAEEPSDIVFTSGGTEANNQIIFTTLHNEMISGSGAPLIPHIVTTNIEHDSIALPLKEMEERGLCRVTVTSVESVTGAVTPEAIAASCNKETRLVTVMMANNETGVIQPIKEISNVLKRVEQKFGTRIYLHTDAAQTLGKVPVDVKSLGVDYLTVVGHKFYGPRIGALFVKGLASRSTPLSPTFYGGGQEKGHRPGTENTPMICGLGAAAHLLSKINTSKMQDLRDYFESELKRIFGSESVRINFENSTRLPNTSSVAFPQIEMTSTELLRKCKSFVGSTGAACHSGSTSASKILLASGIPEKLASRTIRFSIGKETKEAEINTVLSELQQLV